MTQRKTEVGDGPIRWSEFKRQIEDFVPLQRHFRSRPDGGSMFLFRGHASNEWKLKTTLERFTPRPFTMTRYLRACTSARRLIGNYLPDSISYTEGLDPSYEDVRFSFPNFEYMAFLRHHGFPSPLLDWTESPYVAAFFALRNPCPENPTAARVYCYQSDRGSGRGFCLSEPHIRVLGPFASVHERHAIQQCWYTICLMDGGNNVPICSHEEAFNNSGSLDEIQDRLIYFDIDPRDREKALADLFSMNISAYSLFRSIDSLMETASHRVFPVD